MFQSRLYSISSMLFYILFLRASLDPFLNMTKIGGIGLGALLNLIVVVLFSTVCVKSRFVIPKTFLSVWGLFLFFGFLSIFISPDKISSMRSFFSILTYWALFNFTYYFIRDRSDVHFFLKFVILSSIIPFLFVIYEFLNPESSTTLDGFRLYGSFSHPNIFAFYLVLIGTLCIFSLKSKILNFSTNFVYLFRVIFFVCLICLLFTKTRSAWISMSVIIFIYGIVSERKYLFILTMTILVSLLIPSVQDRIFDIFSGVSTDDLAFGENLNSYAWRKLVWLSSWDYIVLKPFLGHGYDTFSYYFLEFFPLQENANYDAHNAYVQIAFDMGFFGLLSFLIIFVVIILRLYKCYYIDKSGVTLILSLNISYLITSYSDNMLFYLSYNWYFWTINGMCFYFYHNFVELENG